jgi:hypothetical protein
MSEDQFHLVLILDERSILPVWDDPLLRQCIYLPPFQSNLFLGMKSLTI